MKKAIPAGRQGFTLIEMVVVVSVLMVLMVTITTVLVNSFKARNRVDVSDRLEQNGNGALMEIKNNFYKASGADIVCPVSGGIGSSITFKNINDGKLITLTCFEGAQIASGSAKLTSSDVRVTGCGSFVTCVKSPTGEVMAVDFSFVLSSGVIEAGTENFSSRKFESKVTVRN